MSDDKVYATFLKSLIVQGLVRLLEKDVVVQCRKVDEEVIEKVIPEAVKEFNQYMRGVMPEKITKDIEVNLKVMKNKYLSTSESRLGGVVLLCHGNHIVFKNTVESRLDLCFADSKPDIREKLFPNMKAV